jgi:hypothetical protein
MSRISEMSEGPSGSVPSKDSFENKNSPNGHQSKEKKELGMIMENQS